MTDILAHVSIGGGGSWGRASTEEEALRLCAMHLRDWKSLCDILGKDVEVGLYNVEGHDKVVMGGNGVWALKDGKKDVLIEMYKIATVHVPTDAELEAAALKKAQQYKTPAEVVKAYLESDGEDIGFETALLRLQELGLSERKADDMLLESYRNSVNEN